MGSGGRVHTILRVLEAVSNTSVNINGWNAGAIIVYGMRYTETPASVYAELIRGFTRGVSEIGDFQERAKVIFGSEVQVVRQQPDQSMRVAVEGCEKAMVVVTYDETDGGEGTEVNAGVNIATATYMAIAVIIGGGMKGEAGEVVTYRAAGQWHTTRDPEGGREVGYEGATQTTTPIGTYGTLLSNLGAAVGGNGRVQAIVLVRIQGGEATDGETETRPNIPKAVTSLHETMKVIATGAGVQESDKELMERAMMVRAVEMAKNTKNDETRDELDKAVELMKGTAATGGTNIVYTLVGILANTMRMQALVRTPAGGYLHPATEMGEATTVMSDKEACFEIVDGEDMGGALMQQCDKPPHVTGTIVTRVEAQLNGDSQTHPRVMDRRPGGVAKVTLVDEKGEDIATAEVTSRGEMVVKKKEGKQIVMSQQTATTQHTNDIMEVARGEGEHTSVTVQQEEELRGE